MKSVSRLVIVLLLLAVVSAPVFAVYRGAPPEDVQKKVRTSVVEELLAGQTEGVRVVMTPRVFPVEDGFRLEWSGGPIYPPENAAWMAIADEMPGVLGFHPVKHVFFDADLAIIEVRDATVYPRFYVEGERQDWFTLVEYHAPPGKVPEDRERAISERSKDSGEKGFTYQEFYAVIIQGDVASGSYPEFWTDPVQMYRLLLEYGYQPGHIHVLYADGEDESDWSCEYYREAMVDFPAYKQDVRDIFTWMRDGNAEHGIPQVTDEDFVFLFTFDHGGSNGGCDSTLCLMDGCMPDDEFASYFNDVPYKHRAVDMQQCNSGGFIDNLENSTTVISTAANCGESAYQANETDDCEGVTTTKYGEWDYWWMSAMRSHKPWPGEEPVDADVNDDGKVSFQEAHNYAVDNDDRSEHPQWSDPGGIGDELSLQTTWQGAHLVHDGHSIDDADGGNGDGVANPDETIVMPVTLYNNGQEDATGTHGTLSTDSEWVTIEDSSADWPDIPVESGAESLPDHYRWKAGAETPDDTDVLFHIDWNCNGGDSSGTTAFHEKIVRVILAVQKTSVLDDEHGDGDGIADPGESIQLAVTLRNKGHAAARQVHGTLSTSSPWVTITDDQADWPDIAGDTSGRSLPDHFGVDVDPQAPEKTWVDCTLDVTAADGYTDSLPLRFMIGSRGTVLLVEDGDTAEADFMEDLLGDLGFGVERQLASETDSDTWLDYHALVWDAGSNTDSVADQAWRDALEQFIADGGRLLITGGEIGYDHRYHDSFRQNVLHMASWRNNNGGDLRVIDETHPITTVPNVLDQTLPASTASNAERDAVRETSDARMILDWTSSSGNASLVAFDDDSLEGNGGQIVSLFARAMALSDESGQRRQLVENSMEWLLGADKPYLLYTGHEVLDGSDNGNGDGIADPGETIHLAVDLENQGSDTATVTWARAETNHPEIAHFSDNYAEWPEIVSGAAARTIDPHFILRFDEDAACGTVIEVTLHINTEEGFSADRVFSFELGTGGGEHTTYPSTDTPLTIPNPGIADSMIDVPDGFRIGDVNCHVDIEHSSISLIKVILRGPDGKQVVLHDMSGSGMHLETTYDTQTQPDGPGSMSDYDGDVGTGEWHLLVNDLQGDMMMGELNSWSLIFDTSNLCHEASCDDDPAGDVGNTLLLTRIEGSDDVHLEWASATGADAYNVWRSRHGDFSDPESTGHTTLTSYDEVGVPQRSSIYLYQVRAENACHEEGP